MQKISKTLAIIGLVTPLGANALGVGEIRLQSALNQRLSAEIPLALSAGEDPNDIRVSLASAEAFARVGLERPYYLSGMRFQIVPKGRGHVVKITSSEPLREPFVSFVLELNWREGQLRREFTLLLDPPSLFKGRKNAEMVPTKLPAKAEPAAAPSENPTRNESVAPPPVESQDTLGPVTGARLGSDSYGPVRSAETLWSIAKVVSRSNGSTLGQTLMALYKANPEAFNKADINSLKLGATLRLPTQQELAALSAAEAAKAVHTQRVAEVANRAGESTAVATPPRSAKPAKATPAAQPSADAVSKETAAKKELTLAAPADREASGAKKGKAASKAELALEMADTIKQENEEIRSRLAQLEKQLNLTQRLLTLKDEQIAALQGGKPMPALPPELAAKPAAPVSAPEAPKPAIQVPAREAPKPAEPVAATPAPVEAAPSVAKPAEPPAAPEAAKPELAATPEAATETPQPPQPAVATPPSVAEAPKPVATETAQPAETPEPAPPAPAQDAPAATPTSASAPPPVGEQDDSLFAGKPLYTVIAGILAALAGGIGFVTWKRRRDTVAELAQEAAPAEIRPINVAAAVEGRKAESSPPDLGIVSSSQQGAFLSDFTPSDFDVLDGGTETIDPISEADVYLAYGRYQQAEDLIRQAINENPFRDVCKLKLLEVFYTAQNRTAFEHYASGLVEEGKNADDDFWARVVDMGRTLCPDHPLFASAVAGGAGVYPAATDIEQGLTFDLDATQPRRPTAAGREEAIAIDFDLDGGTKTSEAANDGLDFSFDPKRPNGAPRVVSAVTTPMAEVASQDHELDFDLDFNLEPAPTVEPPMAVAKAKAEFQVDASSPEATSGLMELDFSLAEVEPPQQRPGFLTDSAESVDFDFSLGTPAAPAAPTHTQFDDQPSLMLGLTDMDEMETKLDLAKAYVDMESYDAAKPMLDDVLRDGNDSQKREAQSLLAKLHAAA